MNISPVPHDLVTRVWQELAAMDLEEVPVLIEQMRVEQPALMAYLLASEGYGLSREEIEDILYVGIVVWQIMKRGHPELTTLSIDQIEKAEDKNLKTLEFLDNDTEADFVSATQTLVEGYPEPEVFRYIVEAIVENDDDSVEISEEAKGAFFLHLKTELDAFINSIQHSNSNTRLS